MKFFRLLLFLPLVVFSQYVESDWEDRDAWMPLELIYEVSNIKEGIHVADIGCHEGYFSIHLANRVGEKGRVYAVDVREDRLDRLKVHLDDRNLDNVEVILGDYDNPKLPENTLDVVVIMDTYHEMTDYMDILEHVHNALVEEGTIVIIEKFKSRIKGKSREAQVDAHSLSTKYVKRELKKAGFEVTYENNNIGLWEKDEDKVMWILVAQKK